MRVRKEVLHSPLAMPPLHYVRRGRKRLALFAYVLYSVFGSFLFSCNNADQSVSEVPIEKPSTLGSLVMDSPASPVAHVSENNQKNPLTKMELGPGEIKPHFVQTETDTVELPEVTVSEIHSYRGCGIVMGGITFVKKYQEDFLNCSTDTSKEELDELPPVEKVNPAMNIYPNPSEGNFQVEYKLTETANIHLQVFNEAGQVVRKISSSEQDAGTYIEQMRLNDVAAGLYFVRIQISDTSITRRIVIAR